MNELEQYLSETSQTKAEVLAGASQVGLGKILTELIPQALKEKKKLVWEDDGRGLGGGLYVFQDL